METEIQPNIPSAQLSPQTPSIVPMSTNWSKILLFTIVGLVIVAGLVSAGIQIGKNQTSSQQPIVTHPTASPTQAMTNPAVSLTSSIMIAPTTNLGNNLNTTKLSCDKEENCCVMNDDCKYVWFIGVCNTPEYVTKIQKEAEAQGRRNGEAPPRENVTCTCEHNKCLTHN